MKNALFEKDIARKNLIGNWELIGHGEGWIPAASQPCSFINISESELVLTFQKLIR